MRLSFTHWWLPGPIGAGFTLWRFDLSKTWTLVVRVGGHKWEIKPKGK